MGFIKTVNHLTFPQLGPSRDPFMRAFAAYPARRWPSRVSKWAPLCELFDEARQYVLQAEIPGALREHIRLTVKVSLVLAY